MTSTACCLRQESRGPLGPTPSRGGEATARVSSGTGDHFDLLRRATQMMATGALSEDQAKTLSRQILTSVAWNPGH
ncbi:MAG: hypothetical protein H7270_14605 [Dermatophilaceae bacterium]|nr:hypothetical protein [Dermatophilaceae bacterium]